MLIDQIQNRDCVEGMRELPDESVDCVVTDCPYEIVRHGSTGCGGMLSNNNPNALNGKIFEHNDIDFDEYLPELYRVLKQDTHCYIMINARNLKNLQVAAEKAGFKFQNLLVWRKNTATPNKFYMQTLEFILMLRKGRERWVNDMGVTNCLSVPNIIGKTNHPTEKPIALMRVMVEQSTKRGDLVLDPFMGAGSTALACVQSERHFVGFEIDKKYHAIAERRLAGESRQLTLF